MHPDDEHEEIIIISKSQLKREAEQLQKLGEQLIELSNDTLKKFSLPDELRNAIELARSIHQHGGRKRQMKYVGRMLRTMDAAPIQAQLDALQSNTRDAARQFHKIEHWRDRLLTQGDDALGEFLKLHPAADSQQFRQLIRSALAEQKDNKPPQAARALFKLLRQTLGV